MIFSSEADQLIVTLVVIVAVWLGLAFACGYWARSIMRGKGRSGGAGFWLGFLFGLTGLLIVALLSPTPQAEATKMRQQMQLMGMPVPSVTGASADAPMQPAQTLKRPVTPVGVIAVAAGICSMGLSFGESTYDSKGVTILVLGLALGLAVAALVVRTLTLTALAVGVGLGVAGLTRSEYRGISPFDVILNVLIIVGAILAIRGSRETPPVKAAPWWQKAAYAGAAVGAISVVATRDPADYIFIIVGFGIIGWAIDYAGRPRLALALGWAVTVGMLAFIGDDASTFTILAAVAMAVLAAWGFSSTTASITVPMPLSTKGAPPPPLQPPAVYTPPPQPFAGAAHVAQNAGTTVPRRAIAAEPIARLRLGSGELLDVPAAFILGRAPHAPVGVTAATFAVMDRSMEISATHCIVKLAEGAWWVEDLGSTNGTIVVSADGTTRLGVGQRIALTADSHVQLGENWCRLEL